MDARVAAMATRIRNGETLAAVGKDYDITRERVRQLVKRAGLTGHDGMAARAEQTENRRRANRDARYLKKWGMGFDEYCALVGAYGARTIRSDYYRSPLGAYITQRNNARLRGIGWEFTLKTWWTVWCESGKWERRGIGADRYHMSRPGDKGPYSPTNVKIIPHGENSRECRLNHPDSNFGPRHVGGGRGWQLNRSKTNPYQVVVRGKGYGSYPTPDAARSKYLAVCAELNAQREAA